MNGTPILDQIEIQLRSNIGRTCTVYINVYESSFAIKWLRALNNLLSNNYHLEKNYCFVGFPTSERNGKYILDQVNASIAAINAADIGYQIDDHFEIANTLTSDPDPNYASELTNGQQVGRNIIHEKLNWLHRYFEDLQGVSGQTTEYFARAGAETRWHIRQLNLLCHEFESWALSYRKLAESPDWICPSQLMCWLNAPRFELDEYDYDLFGIDTLNRKMGSVYVGVNKAVGKHHWEVFNDEGRDSRVGELVTTTLRSQSEAAGDFDIEWGRYVGDFEHRKRLLTEFREWLIKNGFDPEDKSLTIGHPQVGEVLLEKSFGSTQHDKVWYWVSTHMDVYSIKTSDAHAVYDYRWSDPDYMQQQIAIIGNNK